MKEGIRLLRMAIMRSERRSAHETGHQTPREPELCFPGEIGHNGSTIFTADQYQGGEDEEISLFLHGKLKRED